MPSYVADSYMITLIEKLQTNTVELFWKISKNVAQFSDC